MVLSSPILLLIQISLALDIKSILNPNLSPNCQISVNSILNTLIQSCISPYDIYNLEQGDFVGGLKGFSMLPTFCNSRCRRVVEEFGIATQSNCEGQAIVKEELGKQLGEFVAISLAGVLEVLNGNQTTTATSAATNAQTTASSPPATPTRAAQRIVETLAAATTPVAATVPQPQPVPPTSKAIEQPKTKTTSSQHVQVIKRQSQDPLKEYFAKLTSQKVVQLMKAMDSILCVLKSEKQQNPILDEYCLKGELDMPFKDLVKSIYSAVKQNQTQIYCTDCVKGQVDNTLKVLQEFKVFGDRLVGAFGEVNKSVGQCTGLKDFGVTGDNGRGFMGQVSLLFVVLGLLLI